ncbi:Enoyl-CoA hydratase/carnithine racemase [Fulvimarina manganoxydans]|uniref:Enoyl-CoA hydratase/carnithine racemase n=1 Tax=Fulvimarina manganoxydans TaxID=937218 RepID=A0A1W1YH54_9HYPH|nr:crotonase/enoyl-CoA hydratase family protein [Fulvimarina manganoxydans]SMC35505.1 Enoyl-CoA hydratase/carnithine racemase [Fulvimarina manganoxydans]
MSAIETSIADGVLTLRLNRPEKKNALSRAMYAALAEAMEEAGTKDVKVVLIAGQSGAFSAGNDLADFLAVASGGEVPQEIGRFLNAIVDLSLPLVASVDGLAIGIGTTLLMHCDYVVASKQSVFRTPFADLGLTPEAASSLLAPRLMGHQRAFALLAIGETFDAEAARAAGLVTKVVENDPDAAALTAAQTLAAKPAEAIGIAKRLLRGDKAEIKARIEEEITLFSQRLVSPEARRAFEAFLKK